MLNTNKHHSIFRFFKKIHLSNIYIAIYAVIIAHVLSFNMYANVQTFLFYLYCFNFFLKLYAEISIVDLPLYISDLVFLPQINFFLIYSIINDNKQKRLPDSSLQQRCILISKQSAGDLHVYRNTNCCCPYSFFRQYTHTKSSFRQYICTKFSKN